MVAHEKKVTAALTKLFEQRDVDKRYQVIVAGRFSEASGPWAKQQTFNVEIEGKPAISHVRSLAYNGALDCSLLEVIIETGRKHQIRRHLAGAGFPVVGDRLYGKASEGDINLQLAASSLAFVCPVTGVNREYILPAEQLPQL